MAISAPVSSVIPGSVFSVQSERVASPGAILGAWLPGLCRHLGQQFGQLLLATVLLNGLRDERRNGPAVAPPDGIPSRSDKLIWQADRYLGGHTKSIPRHG
jgi:hypothetical protein